MEILLSLKWRSGNLVDRFLVVALEGDSLVGRLWGLVLMGGIVVCVITQGNGAYEHLYYE